MTCRYLWFRPSWFRHQRWRWLWPTWERSSRPRWYPKWGHRHSAPVASAHPEGLTVHPIVPKGCQGGYPRWMGGVDQVWPRYRGFWWIGGRFSGQMFWTAGRSNLKQWITHVEKYVEMDDVVGLFSWGGLGRLRVWRGNGSSICLWNW